MKRGKGARFEFGKAHEVLQERGSAKHQGDLLASDHLCGHLRLPAVEVDSPAANRGAKQGAPKKTGVVPYR
jgi:hypothetical protein